MFQNLVCFWVVVDGIFSFSLTTVYLISIKFVLLVKTVWPVSARAFCSFPLKFWLTMLLVFGWITGIFSCHDNTVGQNTVVIRHEVNCYFVVLFEKQSIYRFDEKVVRVLILFLTNVPVFYRHAFQNVFILLWCERKTLSFILHHWGCLLNIDLLRTKILLTFS